jgi:copper chaperone CopZ
MSAESIERSYSVTGMHCDGCAKKLSGALANVAGVVSATVTFTPPEARLLTNGNVATGVLNEAVHRIGAYQLAEQPGAPKELAVMDDASSIDTEAAGENLYPLFLIVGYIAGTVGLIGVTSDNSTAASLTNSFMAGFFLVFSFFKLLDLRGFSEAYRSYDLLARAVPAWGVIYPFIELGLGIAYILRAAPLITNVVTLAIMVIGAVGVLRALLDKRAIRCACLGTALKLPMTKVTLVEDLTMAAMAAAMLVMTLK